jgi:hypothetical protein
VLAKITPAYLTSCSLPDSVAGEYTLQQRIVNFWNKTETLGAIRGWATENDSYMFWGYTVDSIIVAWHIPAIAGCRSSVPALKIEMTLRGVLRSR